MATVESAVKSVATVAEALRKSVLEQKENAALERTAADVKDALPRSHANPTSSTAYVAMLPYAYTNNDVAQLFAPFGKLARVTILRDKQTRKSRGVAFVQFARAEDCARAVARMHDVELEGFRLACSISRDNGRANEFMRKRKYTPAPAGATAPSMRCFECGEFGHVSYQCPLNVLGARDPPVHKKKLKKKKRFDVQERVHYFNDEGVPNILSPPKDMESDVSLSLLAFPSGSTEAVEPRTSRKRRKSQSYFSDESASEGDE
ncbi:hypothetical protein Poli38472_013053 [Pythium oligandrum]|uniref:Zinc finger CCHC-type and RNA-binding motif-containing protein 1 n=1 Tax=Pythium oligandrum TaxID=41045 RepID=A0A8K1CIW7_PYTOL|nr:hypothetical protein Poli38472_013053 [Pythium oligandrum]|eukprot:TMW64431.1 hypothetical protein Poli38472_013053 [Pythium oligandrum]